MQDNPRDLDLPLENSVFAYCGVCADRYPHEDLHRIVEATGRHLELVDNSPLRDQLAYQLPGSFQEHVESGRLAEETEKWRSSLTLGMSKVGTLRQLIRNAPRENFEEFVEVVRTREPLKAQEEIERIAKEELGYRRPNTSSKHLAKVIAPRDERGTFVTCWRCETKIRFSPALLSRAVEHVLEFGGLLFLSPKGLAVRDASRPFVAKVRRHSGRRAVPN